jgi:hypothetical protein
MGPWQRAEMAGTTTSRSTRSSGNTSFGTGSRSGSGSGSSGPSARSRGRPTPWTRRGGISPADEFGTPLRELADLADQYENAYDYAQHAGMQYLDTGRAGEVEGEGYGARGYLPVTNAALPLGRGDVLPVYTEGRYGSPPEPTPGPRELQDQDERLGQQVLIREEERGQPPEMGGDDVQGEERDHETRGTTCRPVETPPAETTAPSFPVRTVSVRLPRISGTPNLTHGPYLCDAQTPLSSGHAASLRPEEERTSLSHTHGAEFSGISQWRHEAHAAAEVPGGQIDSGLLLPATAQAPGTHRMHDMVDGREGIEGGGGGTGNEVEDSSSSGSKLDFPLPPLSPWNVDKRERESVAIASEYVVYPNTVNCSPSSLLPPRQWLRP